MKGLFVIHSTNMIYGASKSLAQLLNNINCEYDIIFPKSLSDNITDDDIRKVYGSKIKKIYRLWLPYERCFVGKGKLNISDFSGLKQTIKYSIRQIVSKIFKYKLYKIIDNEKYDFVYLNSLTLYPLINRRHNSFIHVREVVDTSSITFGKIVSKLNRASGVVFIDYATQLPFSGYVANELVLNNPFDMSKLSLIKAEEVYLKYSINKSKTIFTILGTVSEMKGVEFIIRCYIKANITNTILFIVGNSNNEYGKKCKELGGNYNDIVFVEELEDPSEIYRISDYILRGDSIFAIGRTVYEGLYSGCNIIIQGNKDSDSNKIFEYQKYKDNIFFYSPRNDEDLIKVIKNRASIKVNTRNYESNINSYIETHEKYIRKCLTIGN